MLKRSLAISALLGATAAYAQREPAPSAQAVAAGTPNMSAFCPLDQRLGQLPNGNTTASYQIPSLVHSSSTWVLIYVSIHTGGVSPEGTRRYKITSEGTAYRPLHYYLHAFGYMGNQYGYNSENLWFPTPQSGHVLVARDVGTPFAAGSNWSSDVRLIGYVRRNPRQACITGA